jgi:hypothetical protein
LARRVAQEYLQKETMRKGWWGGEEKDELGVVESVGEILLARDELVGPVHRSCGPRPGHDLLSVESSLESSILNTGVY